MRSGFTMKNDTLELSDREMMRLMGRTALYASNITKKRMKPPKKGRKYNKMSRGKKGGVLRVHTASAPGEFLATDSGRTRNSIGVASRKQGHSYFAEIGVSTRYPVYWHGPGVARGRYRQFIKEALEESAQKELARVNWQKAITVKRSGNG